MGLFSKKDKDKVDWSKHIAWSEASARDAEARATRLRQSLAKGSTDPEADRYQLGIAERDLSIAKANLRDIRRMQD